MKLRAIWISAFTTIVLLCGFALAEARAFDYRFADAGEGIDLLLGNREYLAGFNQNDLNYRLQRTDAMPEAYATFAAAQVMDFTEAERAAVSGAMDAIEAMASARGYRLPAVDSLVFIKTTMREECGASAYTHGYQIYLGDSLLRYALSENAEMQTFFRQVLAHELFHCLTRNHPDFRAEMYGILGFIVADEDYPLGPSVREAMISNPDVEHHNAAAAFTINGETKDCVVVFITSKPFENPGDSFFDNAVTGLVPVDAPDTLYNSEDASDFWTVFGRNTDYVIDPEETLADNFAFALVYGKDGREYPSPEIIEAIDAWLTGNE